MTSLTFIEKKLLEELLEMGGGYVLDFSDRTYESFFKDFGVEIEAEKYHRNGRSKANRMRAFWELDSDPVVGRVIEGLINYVESCDSGGLPVEQKHRRIADRLLGRKGEHAVSTENDFLAADFGRLDVGKLDLDASINGVIEHRLEEIQYCLQSNSPLAAILLSGSALEGILLNFATARPQEFNAATASPKVDGKVKAFQDWSLNDLINVASELGLISVDVKKFSHALRDFRNYIHPFEQASSGFRPDEHTAKISWQVLRAAIADLSGAR